MENRKYKELVAKFMTRLYDRGLTSCSGGNISLKSEDNKVYITPSQIDKGNLTADLIGIVDLETGKNLTPNLKLSMETDLHLAVYKKRPDVNAIIHAHPTYATSFTAVRRKINVNLAGEARAILGNVVFAPYALMGTTTLAENVSKAALDSNVVLMENHGILTCGKDLMECFNRTEVLETTAKMTFITTMLGEVKDLPEDKAKEIDDFMKGAK